MSRNAKIAAGAAAAGLLLLFWLPGWAVLLIVLGVPAAYFALDPVQRRRLRRVSRKQLGR